MEDKEEVGITLDIPVSEEALIIEEIKEKQTPVHVWSPKTQIGREVKSGKIEIILAR